MKTKIDLRLRYKNETGKCHTGNENSSDLLNDRHSKEYSKWLEENHINLINIVKKAIDRIGVL